MKDKYKLVFLIGAARSGTKLVRTILEQSENISVIPYDMNYIWKYGNYNVPHDELNDIELSEKEKKFIKNYIDKQQQKTKSPIIVEKTVSNCLRVDFIKKIFPDAKIIHLYRDGRDVALSAKDRWEGNLFDKEQQSKKDIFKKLLDLPLLAVMPYLLNYIKINVKHIFSTKSSSVESWGPIYNGIDIDKDKYSLLELCSLQWKKSVESTLKSLSKLKEGEEYINIKYEDLLSSTNDEVKKLVDFINIQDSEKLFDYCDKNIRSKNMNKWTNLEKTEIDKIELIEKDTLTKLGYKI
ncbi:sulfotransferase [Sulfurimonas sp.]|uniref:sulfotransferase family protein n=1 Tax=Sulfurimonas sp. TaxID=2022749 RepID=UPI00356592B7